MIKILNKLKKHLSKRSVKNKIGSTLIELIAVVCILSIASTVSISGLFAMADIAKRGQDLSLCERTSDMISKQLSIYGNTSNYVESYDSKPQLDAYPSSATGFMDAEITKKEKNKDGEEVITYPYTKDMKNDYFLYADPNTNYRIVLARFEASDSDNPTSGDSNKLTPIVSIDNVKSIKFDLKKLNTDEKKYILQYTVTTVGSNVWDKDTDKRVEYTISSGVVLNNTNSSNTIPDLSYQTITTKTPLTNANSTYIRIRTTSRSGLDIH